MTSFLQRAFRTILVTILVLSMLFVAACGDNGGDDKDNNGTSSVVDTNNGDNEYEGNDTSNNESSNNESSNNSSTNNSSNPSADKTVDTLGGELKADVLVDIPENFEKEKLLFPRDRDIVNSKTGTPKKGDSDAVALKRREEILKTPNNTYTPGMNGKTYYVSSINGSADNDGLSPEKPIRDVSTLYFEPGSVILFERGSVFRLNSSLNLRSNTTYGAYGEGEKPALYGSPYNYAKKEMWQPSRMKNVWYASFGDTDCSSIVFNHGEDVGVKKNGGLDQLGKNGDFFHNATLTTVYLYCDKGNPGEIYDDIEIVLSSTVLNAAAVDNVKIDNLSLKYGNFGIRFDGNSSNISITNCEIGFIGGANIGVDGVRYGNGIEIFNGAGGKNYVNNCWIYQCFDTGFTWQGKKGNDYNISFTNNLLEYNCCSIEFWDGMSTEEDQSDVNFICNNNISRFSGFGWGNRSWDNAIRGIEGHIGGNFKKLKNVYAEFKNNIFDQAWNQAIRLPAIYDESDANPLETRKIIFEGNSYYEGSEHYTTVHSTYGTLEKNPLGEYISQSFTFNNEQALKDFVAVFESNPKVVKFLG